MQQHVRERADIITIATSGDCQEIDLSAENGDTPLSHQRLNSRSHEQDIMHPSSDVRVVMREILLDSDVDSAVCFLDEGSLRKNLGTFRSSFLPDMRERRIIYAMKANPRRRIMEILRAEGLDGFDCASINEVNNALGVSDMDPSEIYFNNPIKSPSAIRSAMMSGVRYFTAQSRSGVENILQYNSLSHDKTEVAIRAETRDGGAVIDLSEKFGSTPHEALELIRMVRDRGAAPALSMHTGSQNTDPRNFVQGIEFLTKLARSAGGVSSLNIGGGIPTNLSEQDHYNLGTYLSIISRAVVDNIPGALKSDRHVEPRLILEPGRALVAEAVDLAIPILEIHQRRNEKRLFMGDGLFTSFSDAAIHKWKYHFDVLPKDGRQISEHTSQFRVFGQTCDSGDDLGDFDLPSDMKEGDWLLVHNAGAYMDAQASGFNDFDPPCYVFYNHDGR